MRFSDLRDRLSVLFRVLLVTVLACEATDAAPPDLGPFLSATIELAEPEGNLTLKGLLVDLGDPGEAAGTFCFDTELLRASGAILGRFPQLTSTAWGGGHAGHTKFRAPLLFGTRRTPGWSFDGSFEDSRPVPHGPIPKARGRYRGLYRCGRSVVIDYEIQGTRILESPARKEHGDLEALTRSFHLAPRERSMSCVLADADDHEFHVDEDGRLAILRESTEPSSDPEARGRVRVFMDRSAAAWKDLPVGPPSSSDYADRGRDSAARASFVPGLARPHALAGARGVHLPRLLDGVWAQNDDDTANCVWLDAPRARVLIDLGAEIDVARVDTFSWHRDVRAPQKFTLWADSREPTADGGSSGAEDLEAAGWTRLAAVDTSPLGQGGSHVSSVLTRRGSLGRFRRLLWALECPTRGQGFGTFLTEIDIHDAREPLPAIRVPTRELSIALADGYEHARLAVRDGRLLLDVDAGTGSLDVQVVFANAGRLTRKVLETWPESRDLRELLDGGPSLWPKTVPVRGQLGSGLTAYTVDTIPVPEQNPYGASSRLGGLDFFEDSSRAAVCTWKGDVWIVSGIDAELENVTWRRYAAGLFDALGLKIVDDVVHVHGRDQITRLHDTNGDGEADHYECFNNDVMITTNFHEFAFDLQTDRAGNFYFSKGGPVRAGGHGFEKIVPHHGCVLRVTPDGSELDVYATGLRAPNGIGVGPDGQVTTGDNEGSWVPRCRISWCRPGSFEGVVPTSQIEPPPSDYNRPLCWLPKSVDNSSGGRVWVTSQRWGPLGGELLHLSYGQTALYHVLRENVGGVVQGGVVRFPFQFESGGMRARFNPGDGQLYVVGLRGWQSRAARATCFQRVRFTGAPVRMPTSLRARKGRLEIEFTTELDARIAERPGRYSISMWNYLWTENYGSPEVSVIHGPARRSHDTLDVTRAVLSRNRRRVTLHVPDLRPCMQMKIAMNLRSADGKPVRHEIYNTIHTLGD